MICPKCHSKIPDGSSFCCNCGTNLRKKPKSDGPDDGKCLEGINECFFSVLGYLCAIINLMIGNIIVLLITILIQSDQDKDDTWLKKQNIQALILCFLPSLTIAICEGLNVFINVPVAQTVSEAMVIVIEAVMNALAILLSIAGAIWTGRKRTFNIPIISGIIDKYLN